MVAHMHSTLWCMHSKKKVIHSWDNLYQKHAVEGRRERGGERERRERGREREREREKERGVSMFHLSQ